MTDSELLASSKRSYVIAPAGCGKTDLISRAVAEHSGGRELVLTHTHAGVDALRRRLKKMGAKPGAFHVGTIAGWALQYASAFPSTSGLGTNGPTLEWAKVYPAAANVLRTSWASAILKYSYSGVYVDEYQDCTVDQHQLILLLAELIPCRILGDPLQGIFRFGKNTPIDWETHVAPTFTSVLQPSIGWRWQGGYEQFGAWLQTVRASLISNTPIDLKTAPSPFVRWCRLLPGKGSFITQLQACKDAAKICNHGEKVVVIMTWESQCLGIANRLSPLYTPIETIECEQLIDFARTLDASAGIDRAKVVIEFSRKCLSGVSAELSKLDEYVAGLRAKKKASALDLQLQHLHGVAQGCDAGGLLACLESMQALPDAKLWRRELFFAMCQALREYGSGEFATLAEAAWQVRELTRKVGRNIRSRSIGRTLLVKGLEFEHVVLLNADELDRENLYVALTRASKSLTVLSREPILRPKATA